MTYKNLSSLSEDQRAACSALIQRVCRANPNATAAFLVDTQGNIQSSEGVISPGTRAALNLVLPLRELAERAAAELGCGVLQEILLSGNAGILAIADVDGERTAVVIGHAKAPPGALRADAIWLARAVRDLG